MTLDRLALLASLAGVLAAVALTLVVLRRRPLCLRDWRGAALLGLVWLAFLLLEYYVLGPYSYIYWGNDGDGSIPWSYFLLNHHDGGQFSHLVGGGADVDAVMGLSTTPWSLERSLVWALPLWLAIVMQKVLVIGTGLVGAYLLARRVDGVDRAAAAAVAALYSVSHYYFTNETLYLGFGFLMFPLALALGIGRIGQRGYWAGLALLAVMAATAFPSHVVPALGITLVTGSIVLGRYNPLPAVGVTAVLVAAIALNWADSLLAQVGISALSARGEQNFEASFAETLVYLGRLPLQQSVACAALALSLAVLLLRRDPLARRLLAALAIVVASFTLIRHLPWQRFGLGAVQAITLDYVFMALPVLAIPAVARVIALTMPRAGAWPVTAVVLVAVGLASWQKMQNFAHLLYYGGQIQYTGIANLKGGNPLPSSEFRTVTLRNYRPEVNVVNFVYGIPSLDGSLNLLPRGYSVFWRDGVLRGDQRDLFMGRLTLHWENFHDGAYDTAQQADLDLLRMANVGYIVSPEPLHPPLTQVSGPPASPAAVRSLSMRVGKLFDFGEVYIYRLDGAFPKAYGANAVIAMPAGLGVAEQADLVRRNGPGGAAVIADPAVDPARWPVGQVRVEAYHEVRDGIDIEVSSPAGGVLLLNTNWYPYWRAEVNGVSTEVAPANLVQLAVVVPPGGGHVRLRYHRPTLPDIIAAKFQ